jgi:hypothetical protein
LARALDRSIASVLRYIENHSAWQTGLPPQYRLPNFATGELKAPQDALDLLAEVRLRRESGLPMIRPPGDYVRKLQERLEVLKRDERKTATGPSSEKGR